MTLAVLTIFFICLIANIAIRFQESKSSKEAIMKNPEFAVILPANHQVGNNSSAALISEGYSRCLAEFAELNPKTVSINLLLRVIDDFQNLDEMSGMCTAIEELRNLLNKQ